MTLFSDISNEKVIVVGLIRSNLIKYDVAILSFIFRWIYLSVMIIKKQQIYCIKTHLYVKSIFQMVYTVDIYTYIEAVYILVLKIHEQVYNLTKSLITLNNFTLWGVGLNSICKTCIHSNFPLYVWHNECFPV